MRQNPLTNFELLKVPNLKIKIDDEKYIKNKWNK